jgi:acyl-CoA synthetase (NDP forming)
MKSDMDLGPLLRPRTIAIVGASERPSLGRTLISSLDRLGFDGTILPVNPKYSSVLGRPCYGSVRALPTNPDVVAFCVSAERALEGLKMMAEVGARSAVIYDGGFAERDAEGKRQQATMTALCREAGIALCGPNCMGVLSPHDRSSTYMHEVREPDGLAGGVGLISQSGSICIGLLSDIRRFGFSFVISSGNEAVVNCADYLDFLVQDPDTAIVAIFIETVREPQHFIAALDKAVTAGKPVVVLKVGRSERTQRAITSHTGGLAGESRVFSEVLLAHGAIEVGDLDEMAEVIAAANAANRPAGSKIAVVTGSGGQAELILDVASQAGIDLPPLDSATRAEVEKVIGPITGDGNPLDAWGNGDFVRNFAHALKCLDAAPYDAIVMCSDAADANPMARANRPIDHARLLIGSAKTSEKPHYMLGTRTGLLHRAQIELLQSNGIAVLGGARQGLSAVARLGNAARQEARAIGTTTDDCGLAAILKDCGRIMIHEADSKRLLATCGLPVTREIMASSFEQIREAAATIGWPIALKVMSDRLAHKSEYGAVALSITNEDELRKAYKQLQENACKAIDPGQIAGFLVQEMSRGGLELFVGVNRDPDFGLVIAVGLGGVGIEIFEDFALRLLPLTARDAAEMVAELKSYPLLRGARSLKPYDLEALHSLIERVGGIAWAARDALNEIDLNPVMLFEPGCGCKIIDALIVPRAPSHQTGTAP